MGGIYLLGKQPGTVISQNRIHDVICQNYGGWGIYLDEGSSYVTVEKNLVYRTGEECFDLHYGSHNVVRNNIFVGLSGHYPVRTSKNELHQEVLFEGNLIVSNGSVIYNPESGFNTFTSSKNVFWDLKNGTPTLTTTQSGEDLTLEKWQSIYGQDAESTVIDPRFKDVEKEDFTIPEGSAIYALGFEPLDKLSESHTLLYLLFLFASIRSSICPPGWR
jgi:parallel beta-helix repeat protein